MEKHKKLYELQPRKRNDPEMAKHSSVSSMCEIPGILWEIPKILKEMNLSGDKVSKQSAWHYGKLLQVRNWQVAVVQ